MGTILQKKVRVLGIDTGTAIVGWSVLERYGNFYTYLGSGAIKTSKDLDMYLRLKDIYEELDGLIKEYSPNALAVEDLFYFKNKKTVITVSQARGVILLSGAMNNLPVFDYTPLQVKSAITGYGRAEKDQVAMMIGKILKLDNLPKLDDETDAIAVSICHLNTNNYVR